MDIFNSEPGPIATRSLRTRLIAEPMCDELNAMSIDDISYTVFTGSDTTNYSTVSARTRDNKLLMTLRVRLIRAFTYKIDLYSTRGYAQVAHTQTFKNRDKAVEFTHAAVHRSYKAWIKRI